jgi:hypothetical protein
VSGSSLLRSLFIPSPAGRGQGEGAWILKNHQVCLRHPRRNRSSVRTRGPESLSFADRHPLGCVRRAKLPHRRLIGAGERECVCSSLRPRETGCIPSRPPGGCTAPETFSRTVLLGPAFRDRACCGIGGCSARLSVLHPHPAKAFVTAGHTTGRRNRPPGCSR